MHRVKGLYKCKLNHNNNFMSNQNSKFTLTNHIKWHLYQINKKLSILQDMHFYLNKQFKFVEIMAKMSSLIKHAYGF